MAIEVLVRLKDGPPGSGREKGQIIHVKPYPNKGWGKAEGPPEYGVIRIMDLDYNDPQAVAMRDTHDRELRIRRRMKLDLSSLPQETQEKVSDRRIRPVRLSEIEKHLSDEVNKRRKELGLDPVPLNRRRRQIKATERNGNKNSY